MNKLIITVCLLNSFALGFLYVDQKESKQFTVECLTKLTGVVKDVLDIQKDFGTRLVKAEKELY